MHLSSLGHPIFGDSLYGTEDEEFISRQALHAYGLDFYSPKTKEPLSLRADLPEDMKELINKLKTSSFKHWLKTTCFFLIIKI